MYYIRSYAYVKYPLGEKKLSRYIDNLLGNLQYEIETGRQSILECIRQVVSQFPEKLMKSRISIFFLALSSTFASDKSIDCRERASQILTQLVQKYPSPEYARMILGFFKNENPQQKRLAFLLLSHLSELLKDDLKYDQLMGLFEDLFLNEDFENCEDAFIIAALQGTTDISILIYFGLKVYLGFLRLYDNFIPIMIN